MIIKLNENYCLKIKKCLEEFQAEIEKESFTTTTTDFYFDFVKIFESRLNEIIITNQVLEKEVFEKVLEYSSSYQKKNNSLIFQFENLIEDITDNKNKLEESKHSYFDSSKEVFEYQDKFKKLIEKAEKIKDELKRDEEKKKLAETRAKLKLKSENDMKTYKDMLDKINSVFDLSENKYNEILVHFKSEEEEKFNFILSIFNRFAQVENENCKSRKNFFEQLTKKTAKINIKRDLKILSNRLDYLTNKKRFPYEDFLNYDFLTGKIETGEKLDNDTSKNDYKIASIELNPEGRESRANFICNVDISRVQKEENEEIIDSDDKYFPIVDKIINAVESISNDELSSILYQIDKKKDSIKKFIGTLFSFYKKNLSVQIKNLENMHHLANILITIVNNTLNNLELFNLNFLILYIAEKTIYNNPENIFNRCYLCKLLSKNKIFQARDYWTRLIEIRIATELDKEIKEEIERRETLNKADNTNVLTQMKSFFSFKVKENKKIEAEIIYNQLTKERQPIVAIKIIEDYIQHFSNFNCEIGESIEIIISLSLRYKFEREYVNYFNALLNSNTFTVKNKAAMLENIENKVDYSLLYFSEDFCDKLIYKNQSEILIGNSLKFVPFNDLPSIILLNKRFQTVFGKIIYKNVLLKHHNMTLKSRITIWKILLNYNDIKRRFNYQEIIAKINDLNVPSRDIIELDVSRTPFEKDVEGNRQKILNVLRAVANKSPNIKYCQGMNYIAKFLLSLVDGDEEESFYLFLSLLYSTHYGGLFENDLEILKKYFYVFDRLLNIMMPELYFYLKNNNITVSYFVSPWFITLFTSAFQYIAEKDNPKVLLRIWDLFLFNGFSSVIKIGISLVKHFEEKLLSLQFEDLLQFIINDIIKSNFFKNENFDTLMFITINIKIEDGLLDNIESEYRIKKEIQEKYGPKDKKSIAKNI